MKKNKVLLNIVSFFCFVFGALYIFSLIFIPIGIYCFSAGKKFNYKADHMLDNYEVDKKTMKFYTVFVSIFCFSFGLLSIISYFCIYGNNVKVDGFQYTRVTEVSKSDENEKMEQEVSEEKTVTDVEKTEVREESEEEKLEKLEKLKNFRDKNIISEEEYEMAKEQMFGKDKK